MEDNLRSAADLPYFEGDFWPNVLEESIKELDQEEEEKRKQAEAAEAAVSIAVRIRRQICIMINVIGISYIIIIKYFIRLYFN